MYAMGKHIAQLVNTPLVFQLSHQSNPVGKIGKKESEGVRLC